MLRLNGLRKSAIVPLRIERGNTSINIDLDLGMVLGGEATLIQAMLYLLWNALRYGKLGVAPALKIRSESRDNRIRISVLRMAANAGSELPALQHSLILQL